MTEQKQVIPEGYKQTEVGVIPEDWSISTLGDVLTEFRNGYAFSAKGYCSSGTPILTMAQIGLSGSFQFDEEKVNRWDDHHFNKLKDFWVLDGDLLIAMTDVTPDKNLIGQMTVAKLQSVALLNQRVGLLRVNSQKGIPSFFSYLSCLPVWKSYCKGVASLGVQANIGTNDIRKALVPLPTVKEQTAIANALSDVDALISELEKLIAKKQAIKTATMQQLLTGKTRLPEFALREDGTPKGYKQSELGEIPEDWEAIKMGGLAKIQRGASPRPIDSPIWFDRNSSVGWLRISDVSKTDKYLTETTQSLSELGIANSRFVTRDSLVMSICATVGKPIITKKNLCIHDGFVVFNDLVIEQNYMYYVLKDLEPEWSKQGQTGSQMNLNTELINSTPIIIPVDKEEQTAISFVFSAMDEELQNLVARLNKTRQIKQGMMQELLTGKTRLVTVQE